MSFTGRSFENNLKDFTDETYLDENGKVRFLKFFK